MTALSSERTFGPFSADRDGFVIAEGAGVLVLEELDRAVARGATILAEVWVRRARPMRTTSRRPHRVAPARSAAFGLALADSHDSTRPTSPRSTPTAPRRPLNDRAEAEAIAEVFGGPDPPVTSTKGVTGHSLGAAGAIEAVALRPVDRSTACIPPTVGGHEVDPELPPIDLVTGEGRGGNRGPVVSNSFGFGGHNGCAVFAPAPSG